MSTKSGHHFVGRHSEYQRKCAKLERVAFISFHFISVALYAFQIGTPLLVVREEFDVFLHL